MNSRRLGDLIEIAGDYQHRALHEGNAVQRFWHESKLVLIDETLKPDTQDTILDVGCGSGVCAAYMACKAAKVIGFDGNPAAIEFAARVYQRPNLEFRAGYVDDLAVSENEFSKAICLEVIEHLYEPQVAVLLQSLHRTLRPGGMLLLTTPNYHSLWPVIETSLDLLHLVPALKGEQHVSKFHHRKLRVMCESKGFQLVAQRSICTAGPWLAPLSYRLARALTNYELDHQIPCGTILAHTYRKV